MAYKVLISPRSNVTFNISLHKVCVREGVRYVITKFSRMDSLPNFLTHGALLARASRGSSAIIPSTDVIQLTLTLKMTTE